MNFSEKAFSAALLLQGPLSVVSAFAIELWLVLPVLRIKNHSCSLLYLEKILNQVRFECNFCKKKVCILIMNLHS